MGIAHLRHDYYDEGNDHEDVQILGGMMTIEGDNAKDKVWWHLYGFSESPPHKDCIWGEGLDDSPSSHLEVALVLVCPLSMLRTLELVPHPLNILKITCLQSLTVSDLSLNCLPELSWYQLLCLSSGNTSITKYSSWTLDTSLQADDNDDEWSSSLSDAIMVMSLRKGRLGTCWSDRLTIDMRKTFVTRAVITYHQKIANVV